MYQLQDLLHLMNRLRDPQYGCPWDLKQDFSSLTPHTLEEAYEVVDAAAQQDFDQLRAELGDLLLQVVFYSQLGKEAGHFDFAAVVNGIVEKLLRRHPHVFPDGDLYADPTRVELSPEAALGRWEAVKQAEREQQAAEPRQLSLLDDVPRALPALSRAAKLQKRAAHAGFDWQSRPPVLAKVREELDELQAAIDAADQVGSQEELGDLLFTLVNLARHLKFDPEATLRQANDKFEGRFRYLETALQDQGRSVSEASAEQLEALWQQAKATERR